MMGHFKPNKNFTFSIQFSSNGIAGQKIYFSHGKQTEINDTLARAYPDEKAAGRIKRSAHVESSYIVVCGSLAVNVGP